MSFDQPGCFVQPGCCNLLTASQYPNHPRRSLVRADLLKTTAALCAFVLAGCGGGPSIGDVSGEVKFAGKPLAGASVIFFYSNNKAITSEIADDGKYNLKGVATGPAKIAIFTPLAIEFPGGLGGPQKTVPTIPAKYHDREQSGLTLNVKSGSQIHNIPLE